MTLPVKALLKRTVPLKYRLMRYGIPEKLKYYPQLLMNLGSRVQCPFCGWTFARFLPSGTDSPAYTRYRVVSGGRSENVLCPRCHSHKRERLLYLYLKHKTRTLSHDQRDVLHFAPEPCLERSLRQSTGPRYVTADLDQRGVRVRMDITAIPHPTNSFDVVLCCHVLEHVVHDHRAMEEIYRVLRPEGFAILQVPIGLALTHTLEDPTIVSPAERFQAFGQQDHVRLYGLDYVDKLRSVGFEVRTYSYQSEFGQAAAERYGLNPQEELFVCSKPRDRKGQGPHGP